MKTGEEKLQRDKKGRYIRADDKPEAIKDINSLVAGTLMTARDMTREKLLQEKIQYLSYRDALTGFYNRKFIEQKIKMLDRKGVFPVAVILADVNGLKLTNDVLGYEAGDKLLQKAARALIENCRDSDIIARWGSDEFLVILPWATALETEERIRKIKDDCSKKAVGAIGLSVSLGYAVKTGKEQSLRLIIKEAEEGLYHQKLLEGQSHRNSVISLLITTLYEKSMETEKHAERLKHNCKLIGTRLGCSNRELQDLALLAMLHDIGKIGINEAILQKPGPLDDREWKEMKKHSAIGCRIAQNTPELASLAEYILSHHERWDGKGYPRGLAGEEIPLLSRILAVADAYDAMVSDRAYRKAVSKEEALAELKRNAGTQFDPLIVDVFIDICAKNS